MPNRVKPLLRAAFGGRATDDARNRIYDGGESEQRANAEQCERRCFLRAATHLAAEEKTQTASDGGLRHSEK